MKQGINKKQCDYCENDIKFIMDFVGDNIKHIRVCEDHFWIGKHEQDSASIQQRWEDIKVTK